MGVRPLLRRTGGYRNRFYARAARDTLTVDRERTLTKYGEGRPGEGKITRRRRSPRASSAECREFRYQSARAGPGTAIASPPEASGALRARVIRGGLMNSLASALVFCLLLTPQKVGEVETHADKAADFSALHTYAWSKGHDAFDPRAHKAIIAEVETQMTALGFKQAPAASADVLLTYHTVRASEIDLEEARRTAEKGGSGYGDGRSHPNPRQTGAGDVAPLHARDYMECRHAPHAQRRSGEVERRAARGRRWRCSRPIPARKASRSAGSAAGRSAVSGRRSARFAAARAPRRPRARGRPARRHGDRAQAGR